jgi:CheY-like chemotaxis protein
MTTLLNCILLIEDDEPTNFLNRMTLEQAGCARHIRIARSGKEALNYLVSCGEDSAEDRPRPDLIFLDINMPAMDGWEFLEHYRSLPADRKADIVLIMLTTSMNPDDEIRTREMPEVTGYENKPLTRPKLDRLFHQYFD